VASTNQRITSKSILKILHGCVWIFSRFQYLGVFLCRWVSSTCEKYFELRIVAYDCPRLSSPTLNTLFQVRNCNLNAFKRKKHFASRMCKTPGANTIKVLFRKTITSNQRILIKTEDLNRVIALSWKLLERVKFVEGQKAGFQTSPFQSRFSV